MNVERDNSKKTIFKNLERGECFEAEMPFDESYTFLKTEDYEEVNAVRLVDGYLVHVEDEHPCERLNAKVVIK